MINGDRPLHYAALRRPYPRSPIRDLCRLKVTPRPLVPDGSTDPELICPPGTISRARESDPAIDGSGNGGGAMGEG